MSQREKPIKQHRFELSLGLYLNPPLLKFAAQPHIGPTGLVQYSRFEKPNPKAPLKIAYRRKEWLKR